MLGKGKGPVVRKCKGAKATGNVPCPTRAAVALPHVPVLEPQLRDRGQLSLAIAVGVLVLQKLPERSQQWVIGRTLWGGASGRAGPAVQRGPNLSRDGVRLWP